jgi:hypothetical protein
MVKLLVPYSFARIMPDGRNTVTRFKSTDSHSNVSKTNQHIGILCILNIHFLTNIPAFNMGGEASAAVLGKPALPENRARRGIGSPTRPAATALHPD